MSTLTSEPPPPAIAPKDNYRWYVWEHHRGHKDPKWHATCWHASSIEDALKLRAEPLYHTDFHSGIPQKLVRERISYNPCADVLETPSNSYIGLTNGIPDSFALMGVGYGYSVRWISGKIGWVLAFPDAYTATVRLFNPRTPNQPSEDVAMSLEDFVANMPKSLKP